jgi:hypothetical protein
MTSLYVILSATCTNQKTPWVLNPDQNSQEFNLWGDNHFYFISTSLSSLLNDWIIITLADWHIGTLAYSLYTNRSFTAFITTSDLELTASLR